MEKTVYIPIGMDCCVAYNLTRLGLRNTSMPFDWLRLNSVDTVMLLIDSHFQFFLDKDYLKLSCESEMFPLLDDDWVDRDENTPTHEIIKNIKLGITFFHDFMTIDDLDKVKEKYDRRIKRFYEVLNDKTIKKVFVRYTIKPNDHCRLENYFKKYDNCHVITIIPKANQIVSSWKREELDWKQVLI